MKNLINIFITILIGLSMFIVIISISDNILFKDNEYTVIVEQLAIESSGAGEYLELDYNYDELYYVKVNSVELDLEVAISWVWSDEDTIVINAGYSDVGDNIEYKYNYFEYGYNEDYSDSFINLVEIIPTLVLISIIIGIVVYMKMRK